MGKANAPQRRTFDAAFKQAAVVAPSIVGAGYAIDVYTPVTYIAPWS